LHITLSLIYKSQVFIYSAVVQVRTYGVDTGR
jgi:hypothetical protein